MIAIIMPVHNSGRFLKPCIDRLIKNTKYPFKLFLMENGSTDGTKELCDAYAEVYPNIISDHSKGPRCQALNRGLQISGDLDCYIMQDDVMMPELFERDWLEELVKCSKNDKCGAVLTLGGGSVSGPDYLNGFQWAGTWSLFLPRNTINKVGLFDEQFVTGDDIDYSYRIFLSGLLIYVVDFWVEHHRKTEHVHDNSDLIKECGRRFRQKWKIGEYING